MFNIIKTIKNKKYLAVILPLLLIAGLVALAYSNDEQTSRSTEEGALACSVVAEDSLLSLSSDALHDFTYKPGDESADRLGVVVERIEDTDGHRDDINCTYPLAVYYLHVQDKEKARQQYEQLVHLREAGQEVSATYYSDPDTGAVENIKQRLEHLESYEQRIQENELGLPS